MNVYLFFIVGKRRPVFHAEHPEQTTPRDSQGRPVRSRLERRWRGLLATLKRTVRKGGPGVQRLWAWLNRRPPLDEPLLRGLRKARTVTVFHPRRLTHDEARHLWSRYLGRRLRRHLVTLAGDLAISPLVALLMIVPGPNIIGYWFVYRIVTHLLAMRSVFWARQGWIPFDFQTDPALDLPMSLDDRHQVARVSRRLGLDDLDDFLRRLEVRHREKAEEARKKQQRAQARVMAGDPNSANDPARAAREDPHDELADSVF